jgi:hypothetical protein
MVAQALLTQRTDATGTINFTDHALPGELATASNPDKLMPQNSTESHIPLTELQIRFADSSFSHIDNDFARLRGTQIDIRFESQTLIKNNSSHRSTSTNSGHVLTHVPNDIRRIVGKFRRTAYADYHPTKIPEQSRFTRGQPAMLRRSIKNAVQKPLAGMQVSIQPHSRTGVSYHLVIIAVTGFIGPPRRLNSLRSRELPELKCSASDQ